MDAIGMNAEQRMNIYRIIAAVLHLGNITFQESTKDKKGNDDRVLSLCRYLSIS